MSTVHPLATYDAPIVAEMRRVAAAHKGEVLGTHARRPIRRHALRHFPARRCRARAWNDGRRRRVMVSAKARYAGCEAAVPRDVLLAFAGSYLQGHGAT